MKREIKFRFWIPEDEVMLYTETYDGDGYGFFLNKNGLTVESFEIKGELDYKRWFPIDHTIMQFTDLKDKNAKEIYEGDIYTNENSPNNFFTVYYRQGSFCGGKSENSCIPLGFDCDSYNIVSGDTDWMLIVGNIYENPEILK